jgi:CBS domain-containing protein
LLIVDSDNKPIAILTLHDLRRAVAAEVDVRRATVEKWATPSPRTIQTSATIIEAARALIDAGHGHIPVVDEHHRVVGIVSARTSCGSSRILRGSCRQSSSCPS